MNLANEMQQLVLCIDRVAVLVDVVVEAGVVLLLWLS